MEPTSVCNSSLIIQIESEINELLVKQTDKLERNSIFDHIL